MNCRTLQERLIESFDQERSPEETSHLSACSACLGLFEELKRFRSEIKKAQAAPDTAFFDEMRRGLFAQIRENRPSKEIRVTPIFRKERIPVWAPVLAGLLVLALIPVLLSRQQLPTIQGDLAFLGALETVEGEVSIEVYPEDPVLLEEEIAITDELLLAQSEEPEGEVWIQETFQLLETLEETEDLESDPALLEEEFLFLDEVLSG